MSHQLDGERTGFINKKFDLMCMEKIADAPEELAKISIRDLVKGAGAQGAEFILWLTMRGALTGKVKKLHSNYHIAISNTGHWLDGVRKPGLGFRAHPASTTKAES